MIHFQYFKKKYITTDIQRLKLFYLFLINYGLIQTEILVIFAQKIKIKIKINRRSRYKIKFYSKKLFQTNNNYL